MLGGLTATCELPIRYPFLALFCARLIGLCCTVSATIAACSILGHRKQLATGSCTSREPSSRYSLSGGCFGCTYCERNQDRSGPLNERCGDLSPVKVRFKAFLLGQRRKGFGARIEREFRVKRGPCRHVPMLHHSRQRPRCVRYKAFFRGPGAREAVARW